MARTFKRWIDDKHMDRVLHDFDFLFKRVKAECGELDLRLRNNYFNLYYKGNSMAKVQVDRDPYEVKVHQDFAKGHPTASTWPLQDEYRKGKLTARELHPFFSKTNIDRMAGSIKVRNYQEEIRVEQLLITDTPVKESLFFIDRQIQGGALGRSRLDLLALRQIEPGHNRYQFVIVEVKLGNNAELESDVGEQLPHYVGIMNNYFTDFQQSYEKTYQQLHILNLLPTLSFPNISIESPVIGCIVVIGYSGLGAKKTAILRHKFPGLPIIHKLYDLTVAELGCAK